MWIIKIILFQCKNGNYFSFINFNLFYIIHFILILKFFFLWFNGQLDLFGSSIWYLIFNNISMIITQYMWFYLIISINLWWFINRINTIKKFLLFRNIEIQIMFISKVLILIQVLFYVLLHNIQIQESWFSTKFFMNWHIKFNQNRLRVTCKSFTNE